MSFYARNLHRAAPAPSAPTSIAAAASAQTQQTSSDIYRILSYLPISLYAESLRVQSALVTCIATTYSVAPALTGCVKDLAQLWETDSSTLFEDFGRGKQYNVTSLRHGNVFSLVNRALLEEAGLLSRRASEESRAYKHVGKVAAYRSTYVNVNFVTPALPRPTTGLIWICRGFVVLELLLQIGCAILMAYERFFRGSTLFGCMAINTVLTCILREPCVAVFSKSADLSLDVKKTVAGGAALDVHVITSSWNSSRLQVLCGYSSQLHSLTNLPRSSD